MPGNILLDQIVDDIGQHAADRFRIEMQLHAGFQLAEQDRIFHELEKLLAGFGNEACKLLSLIRQRWIVGKQLGAADDAAYRSPGFVGNQGKQISLDPDPTPPCFSAG